MEAAVAYFKVPSQYSHDTVDFEKICFGDSKNTINVQDNLISCVAHGG